MQTDKVTPWLAYSRSSRAVTNRGYVGGESINHGTVDGKTSLCGMAELGGHDKTVLFEPSRPFTCKRCAAVMARTL